LVDCPLSVEIRPSPHATYEFGKFFKFVVHEKASVFGNAFSSALLECYENDTAGSQCTGEPIQDMAYFHPRNVEERRAGPDTVELIVKLDLLEGQDLRWYTEALGSINHRGGRIDGCDAVSARKKRSAVTP
jgi:hypothetical protein